MSCAERKFTPRAARQRVPAPVAVASRAASSAFAVILRTSGLTTNRLAPCTRAYLELLQRELHSVSRLHVLTDLSLFAPAHLTTPRALRRHADAHEQTLRRELPGVEPFAFTVADIVEQWPEVQWPLPGDAAFRAVSEYDMGIRIWLAYVRHNLGAYGNLTRNIQLPPAGQAASRVVSNLLSYFIHEPSLCLWLRRQQQPLSTPFVWVLEEDAPLLGSLRVPLLHLASSPADLVSVFMPHRNMAADEARATTVPGRRHLWSNDAFRATFSAGVTVHKWEHIERYSATLLRRLDGLLATGAAAFGEIFSSTVCNQTAGCTCTDLRMSGHVQRSGELFAWSKPLERRQIQRLFKLANPSKTDEGRGINRWLHGVAGDCDVLAVANCASRANSGRSCEFRTEGAGDGLWVRTLRKLRPRIAH